MQELKICLLLSLIATSLAASFPAHASQCLSAEGKIGKCIPKSSCRTYDPDAPIRRADNCNFFTSSLVCCLDSEAKDLPILFPTSVDNRWSSNLLPVPGSGSCGISTSDKIFGGMETGIDEFPWLALLEYKRKDGTKFFGCGGVLINSKYVLTAAHCIRSDYTLNLVRLGEWDTSTTHDCDYDGCADPVQDISIRQIIIHPEYNKNGSNHHDIALLRLTRPAKLSYFVKPICLPISNELRGKTRDESTNFVVAGWGRTETNFKSNKKLKVDLKGFNQRECAQKYRQRYGSEINDSQLCAGGEEGKDSCTGDSGGPLVASHNDGRGRNFYYLAGLVSYGPSKCGTKGVPGVYTRVSKYIEWIEANIRE
ncbi:CLIP domain-containing serine protease B4-like [Culicoides brevitarsis]|uniref:CLIP domain-containing serine protease B4-like n=1 Tax=Culicoides brevitarsis TaxID=469753 RepID=UPI00307C84AE